MKLYVVYYVPDYYGIDPVCIYATEEEAKALCNKLNEKIDKNYHDGFEYYETELGKVDF